MTTHDPRAVLEAAVAANPNDLVTRLVLADWYDEHYISGGEIDCQWCDGIGTERVADSAGDMDDATCRKCHGKKQVPSNLRQLACDQRLYVAAQAVIDDLDNDEPRLEFARICEHYGRTERAEFIRKSCIVGRYTDCPLRVSDAARGRPTPMRCGGCDYCEARARCDQLTKSFQWYAGGIAYSVLHDSPTPFEQAPLNLGQNGPHFTIRRGFIGETISTLEWWLAHGQAICRENPVIPHAEMITDREPRQSSFGESYKWEVEVANPSSPEASIPSPIWPFIEGNRVFRDGSCWHSTRDAARLALARACIAWARSS